MAGNVVSFLAPGAGSRLDDIDYDAVYKVDSGASDHLYRQCRRYLGNLIPQQASSYLEIGAGTGLFTLAYLSDARPSHALITDVSPKMLEVCAKRLQTRAVDSHTDLTFALWDGTTRCFRDQAFDLIAGFSVLHHILDYQTVLAILRDALTPEGRAVFLEPSLAFHRAMIGFMADVIQTMPLNTPDWSEDDRRVVACWIGENYINTKFHGDQLALELREDKHLFDATTLRRSAIQAGYGEVFIIPFGGDDEAWATIGVYANQLPLSAAARSYLLDHCARLMPGPFVYLAPEDRAPSFLIVLQRSASVGLDATDSSPERVPEVVAIPEVVFRHPEPSFRYSIEFTLEPASPAHSARQVTAQGWIFGDVDVRHVELECAGGIRFPVGALRVDVEACMNRQFAYPLQRALCCGLMDVRPQYLERTDQAAIAVVAVTMGGERYELGLLDQQTHYLHMESLAPIKPSHRSHR